MHESTPPPSPRHARAAGLLRSIPVLLAAAALLAPPLAAQGLGTPFLVKTAFTRATNATGGTSAGTAWLRVPRAEGGVRAVMVLVDNYAEMELVRDPAFQSFLDTERIALAWCWPRGFGVTFDVQFGNDATLLALLADLAAQSGVPEIAHAPLIPFGHSAAAPWAQQIAIWNPGRVAAMIHYKSGSIRQYGTPSWDADPAYPEVPVLVVNGEHEEFGPPAAERVDGVPESEQAWESNRVSLRLLRATGHRVVQAVLPGEGHYAWSPAARGVVEAFLRASLAARLPGGAIARTAPVALAVPPLASGAWVDSRIKDPARHAAAADAAYAGDKADAWWCASVELAQALDAVHRFDSKPAPDLVFPGGGSPSNGITTFSSGIDADRRVLTLAVTATNGAPVSYRLLRGPGTMISANQVRIDGALHGYPNIGTRLDIVAVAEATATHRRAEEVGRFNIPTNGSGTTQTITFPQPADQRSDAAPFAAGATATSGRVPELWIVSGPARIEGGNVVIDRIPAGTTATSYAVTIRAGEWGTSTVRQATAVERTFTVTVVAGAIPVPGPIEVSLVPGGLRLAWDKVEGLAYAVSAGPEPDALSPLGAAIAAEGGRVSVTDPDALALERRFYAITASRP